MILPKNIARLFWDIDTTKSTPRRHKKYYISRVLDKGDRKAVSWLFKIFGEKEVRRSVIGSRMSSRSANYWRKFFQLP
jgi:hypothetical protein